MGNDPRSQKSPVSSVTVPISLCILAVMVKRLGGRVEITGFEAIDIDGEIESDLTPEGNLVITYHPPADIVEGHVVSVDPDHRLENGE